MIFGHQLFDLIRGALIHYGYWAVAGALLLESAGLPLPGEIILLLASFMAYSQNELKLPWIIVVATLAASAGGNLGHLAGWKGGRPLLLRMGMAEATIAKGEDLFRRYGAATVFFARFIFGMRIIAGPLAGVLRMPWKKFTVYNFLGALIWVTVISGVAFAFGSQWGRVAHVVKQLDWALVAVFAVAALIWWLRGRRVESQE